jgi:hypothetical protein
MGDASYQAKLLPVVRLLWEASKGDPSAIPADYCEHLHHRYSDGCVSLAPAVHLVEDYSELEDFEIEEAIELLGKVNPSDWPDIEDISGISLEEMLKVYDKDASEFDFVEDNLSVSEKVEKTLIEVISSVFGDKVSTIRSEKKFYASPKNNFLQEDDGTFAGTFMYDNHKFIFEVYPDEQGWGVTYRLHSDAIDKLPPLRDEDKKDGTNYTRRVRHRGWK